MNHSGMHPIFSSPSTSSPTAQNLLLLSTDLIASTDSSGIIMDPSQHHQHVVDDNTAGGTFEADAAMSDKSGGGQGGGAHNMHDAMDMMTMFFHTTPEDNVLVYGWSTGPTWAAALTCLLFAFLAIVYEALKFVRERLDLQYALITTRKSSPTTYTVNHGIVAPDQHKTQAMSAPLTFGAAMSSWVHWVQAFLHTVQVSLGYILMLVFMYFNIWLCISIVLGSGVGYLLFGWARKVRVINADDVGHCC